MSDSTATHVDQRTHEPGVESDDVDNVRIVVVGLISTALVLASGLGVQALYKSYAAMQRQEKVYEEPFTQAKASLTQQENRLSGYRKPTAGQTAYTIPIERAMKLVVQQQRAEQLKEKSTHHSE